MSEKTKKVKSTGRFGVRYGRKIRQRVLKVEEKQHADHFCPKCKTGKVKRISPGRFKCQKKSCGYTFAGGAYTPETMSGSVVKKMVGQKAFAESETELSNLVSEEKEPKKETSLLE